MLRAVDLFRGMTQTLHAMAPVGRISRVSQSTTDKTAYGMRLCRMHKIEWVWTCIGEEVDTGVGLQSQKNSYAPYLGTDSTALPVSNVYPCSGIWGERHM